MAILLHNLLARAPKLQDADAVARLLTECDEDGASHYTEEDLLADWQKPGFTLATDAKVILTNKGQLVGYVGIWYSEHVRIEMKGRVHPQYRGRGIGMLLLRLAEVRARQHVKYASPEARVAVYNTVNAANQVAKNLLEHEGYALVNHFWRIIFETEEEAPLQIGRASLPESKLKVALDVPYPCVTGTTRVYEPSGLYTVRQYDVYEKELRPGKEVNNGEAAGPQLLTV